MSQRRWFPTKMEAETVTSGFSVKITKGMLRSLEEAIIQHRAAARETPGRSIHTYDHFLYWVRHGKVHSYRFTKADDGSLGFGHALILRDLLITARTRTAGQTRAAICRRIAWIESVLNIDPVTRLGAVVEDPG